MKCLILAGGHGEQLWPLTRTKYPKQFIEMQKEHSTFQATIARNIQYCDEFIILTNYEYRYIVEKQMSAFQGITYRCIYEEVESSQYIALLLSCLNMQPSEIVFVIPSDQWVNVNTSEGQYQNRILQAKKLASEGKIVEFVTDNNQKADWFMFENGVFQQRVQSKDKQIYNRYARAYAKRSEKNGNVVYSKETLRTLVDTIDTIENSLADDVDIMKCEFEIYNIDVLTDLKNIDYSGKNANIKVNSKNTKIYNDNENQAVVVNEVDNITVVNTKDVIYVGKDNAEIRNIDILNQYDELKIFRDANSITYRSWGQYEELYRDEKCRIRKVIIYPGKTIYAHSHQMRCENWTILNGILKLSLDNVEREVCTGDNIHILPNSIHEISNIDLYNATVIEVAYGEAVREHDMISEESSDKNENQLGLEIEPFVRLEPAYKDYLWGGSKLKNKFNKKCDYDIIAESWEISAHSNGPSIVATGRHKGMTFSTYISTVGKEILGWKCQSMTQFPIMIKFIDAQENLSLQVHPDDEYAYRCEQEQGKNEVWYILETEKDAHVYIGFKENVDSDEVKRRIDEGTLLEILNKIETKKGDIFYIPAGTVHAIGAGNLICEIQQNSNCTYRLYDYNRKDKYGNTRELHIEKALDVLNYEKYISKKEQEFEILESNTTKRFGKYFEYSICEVDREKEIQLDYSGFKALVCIEGKGNVIVDKYKENITMGQSVFVHAQNSKLILKGKMKMLIVSI